MVSAIAPHVRRARHELDSARLLVAAARRVDWRSPAVERYMRALDDLEARLRRSDEAVEVAERAAAAADAAPTCRPGLGAGAGGGAAGWSW